jgi:hypothetical protein
MIRIGGVADSKEKPHTNHCQQVRHAICLVLKLELIFLLQTALFNPVTDDKSQCLQ